MQYLHAGAIWAVFPIDRSQTSRDQCSFIRLDLTTSWLTVGNNSAFADPSAALGLIRPSDQSVFE